MPRRLELQFPSGGIKNVYGRAQAKPGAKTNSARRDADRMRVAPIEGLPTAIRNHYGSVVKPYFRDCRESGSFGELEGRRAGFLST